MFFLNTYFNIINTLSEKICTGYNFLADNLKMFCQAYVDTLSMGIGEAPLWSLIFSVVLIIEMYRILQYMAVTSTKIANQVNAYFERKLVATAKVKNANNNK